MAATSRLLADVGGRGLSIADVCSRRGVAWDVVADMAAAVNAGCDELTRHEATTVTCAVGLLIGIELGASREFARTMGDSQ